jgi:two-component system, LytTR family, sensor kinase
MKIRWRQHEFLLVLLFPVISVAGYLWHMKNLTENQINRIYGQPFLDTQTGSFTYFRNVLLLQIGTMLLLFLCYQWIRRSIAPKMVLESRGAAPRGGLVKRYLWMAVQVLLIAFVLGPLMNMMYYAQNRFHYRYPNDTFLPILGTHPQPVTDMLGGLGIVLAPLLLYIAYVWIRENIIRNIERNENTYAARIVNNTTLFLLIYFSILTVIATFNLSSVYPLRVLFYAIIPSAFLVFMANAFWIFPLRDSKSMVSPRTVLYLLVSTLLLTAPFITIPAVDSAERIFLISLAVQLLVITPLSWIYYQKRKDELALVREVNQAAPALAVQGVASNPVNVNTQWLYNTLNELCSTALHDGSEQTAEGIQKLGNIMAPMLKEDRESFI